MGRKNKGQQQPAAQAQQQQQQQQKPAPEKKGQQQQQQPPQKQNAPAKEAPAQDKKGGKKGGKNPGCASGQLPCTTPEQIGGMAQNVPAPTTLTGIEPNALSGPHAAPLSSSAVNKAA
ncbi:hypothetical protein ATCC90586_004964 [Pythium insidiosum]|nr:hypothetical protein ATCC90586_004964 [Pythium insidiosum]